MLCLLDLSYVAYVAQRVISSHVTCGGRVASGTQALPEGRGIHTSP